MKIIPLKKQVIVQKLELPKSDKFIPANPEFMGEACRIVALGPKCRSDYAVGDVVIVLGEQVYSVPQLSLEWVFDDAILMKIEGWSDGK